MSLDRPRLTLNCERLEDRTTPTTYTVKLLSPAIGLRGNTVATFTGGIHTSILYSTDGNGAALVEATSPLEAVQLALGGSVTATAGGSSYTHSPPSNVGGAASEHKAFWLDGSTLWLEDLAGAGGCDWDYDDRKWFVEVAEHIPTTDSGYGDLDIIDSTNTAVSEDKETAVGGWVPRNNDNDNYNFPSATSLTHTLDLSEQTQVVGEDDLVKLSVTLPAQMISWWLTFDEVGIRVWKSADKQTKYTSGEYLNPTTTALWVEGVATDSMPRQHTLQLRTRDGNNQTRLADQVKVTVYDVQGAMNVPGYSEHTYQVTVPDSTPRFVAGNGVVSVAQDDPELTSTQPTTSRTARILWDAGAVVGTYKVYPTADNNFFVTRQVNVVKVEYSPAAPNDNELKYRNDAGAPVQDTTDRNVIKSAINIAPQGQFSDWTMHARLKVTKIEGPVVNGAARGLRFIEVGFVQNSMTTSKHSEYAIQGTTKKRVHITEGYAFLDADEGEVWYEPYPRAEEGFSFLGRHTIATDATNPVTNIGLHIGDRPKQPATDQMKLAVPGFPGVHDVKRFVLRLDFELYFAARTRESVLGSDTIYTQRGRADWWFDGSGEINWEEVNGVLVGVWQHPGGYPNDGVTSFFDVSNGSVVPITTGMTGNKADKDSTWPPQTAWRTV
jgi:hypothetical protein